MENLQKQWAQYAKLDKDMQRMAEELQIMKEKAAQHKQVIRAGVEELASSIYDKMDCNNDEQISITELVTSALGGDVDTALVVAEWMVKNAALSVSHADMCDLIMQNLPKP